MATYTIDNGYKKLQLDDGSLCDVTAPLSVEDGLNIKLIPAQETSLNSIKTAIETLRDTALATSFAKITAAGDYSQVFAYSDAGTNDERIETITHSSASLALTVTETFTYAGSAGAYRLTSIVRS